jgi:hypothetical protein
MSGKGRVYPPLADRLWAKVDKTPGHGPNGDCWVWTGWVTPKGGYGQIQRPKTEGGRTDYVHRVSYELHHGVQLGRARKTGPLVLHRCDNPACVNPEHLFLGDDQDNHRDMMAKGRKRTRYQRGEANLIAKLTEDQVRAIRSDPRKYDDISADYDICISHISCIKNRVVWTHI